MNEEKSNGSNYVTFLQALLPISVVILHTNGVFWIFSENGYWASSNFIECLFYFAVPVYFMISGITLIDFRQRYGIKEYFWKRFQKAGLPYLFWSLFGLAYNVYWKTIDVESVNLSYVLNGVLNSSFVKIYWFFPVLFGIYLCMPLFASVDQENRKSTFKYMFVCGMILNIIVPFLTKEIQFGISFTYTIVVVSEYLIYPVGGVLLYYYPPKGRTKVIVMLLGILGFIIHFYGTYALSIDAGKVVSRYKGYTNLPCVLYSFAVFLGLRDVSDKIMNNCTIRKIVSFMASYSLPIYLLHYFFLDTARRLFAFDETTLLYRLCAPIIVIPIVIIATYLIRKIPLVKKTLP